MTNGQVPLTLHKVNSDIIRVHDSVPLGNKLKYWVELKLFIACLLTGPRLRKNCKMRSGILKFSPHPSIKVVLLRLSFSYQETIL